MQRAAIFCTGFKRIWPGDKHFKCHMDWYLQIFQKPLNVKHTSGITVLSVFRKTSWDTHKKLSLLQKKLIIGKKGQKIKRILTRNAMLKIFLGTESKLDWRKTHCWRNMLPNDALWRHDAAMTQCCRSCSYGKILHFRITNGCLKASKVVHSGQCYLD